LGITLTKGRRLRIATRRFRYFDSREGGPVEWGSSGDVALAVGTPGRK